MNMYGYQQAEPHAVYTYHSQQHFPMPMGHSTAIMFMDDHGVGLQQPAVYQAHPHFIVHMSTTGIPATNLAHMSYQPAPQGYGSLLVRGASTTLYNPYTQAWHESSQQGHVESRLPSQTKHHQSDVHHYDRSKRSHHAAPHSRRSSFSNRHEVNMQKSCTSCRKLWQHCRCANIKNRPDPKPYEKFVPPRLLKKGSTSKPKSEC